MADARSPRHAHGGQNGRRQMTRIPADYREFVRVSVDLPANPKLAMIDDPAAGWAYVVSLCYCGQHLTDGSFPLPVVQRLSGVKRTVPRRLIEAGLWHETGHACDRCPQPMRGMAVVHDYLVHQRSAEEARTLRDARQEAGRRGAESRWGSNGHGKSHGNSDGKSHGNGEASGMANGQQHAWQTDGKPMAEVEEEKEITPPTPPAGGARRQRGTRIPEDFAKTITPEMATWARAECPLVDHRRGTEEFVDYWLAVPGQKGCKLDWPRTWKNRMRELQQRAEERQARRPLRAVSGGNPEIGFWEQ